MLRFGHSIKAIALAMAVVMLATSLPINFAQAAMIGTDQVVAAQAAADDRARVMQFIAREDVRRQIEALGIDPDEAARRTETLSDAEIQQIAGRLNELPAGQDVIIVLFAAALALFLLLIVTDLLGYTDVFPFIEDQTK